MNPPRCDPRSGEELVILHKIISRRSWDRLQGQHAICPGSVVRHLHKGRYALIIPAGCAGSDRIRGSSSGATGKTRGRETSRCTREGGHE